MPKSARFRVRLSCLSTQPLSISLQDGFCFLGTPIPAAHLVYLANIPTARLRAQNASGLPRSTS